MILLWLQFLAAAILIILTGKRLTYIGDGIAEKKKWERSWVGLIIIAFSTSLPELFTSIASAGIVKKPDLVYGNCFGSIAFNITLFALLDLIEGRGAFSSKINLKLILSASVSILLILIVAIDMLVAPQFSFGWIGASSLITVIAYVIGSRLSFSMNTGGSGMMEGEELNFKNVSSSYLWLNYFFCALLILGGGIWLALTAGAIVDQTKLSGSFVGFLFLAVVTSLPELSTTISAVKQGYYDMTVGIILGANCFNILMLFFADLVYTQGPLARDASPQNVVMMLVGICLTSILMIGIIYRSQKTFLRLGWDAISLIIVYISGMVWLYHASSIAK